MQPLDRIFHACGGLASVAELRQLGLTTVLIEIFASYGSLDRVRHGWYAAPGTAESVRRAWQLGGRLTCVSALAHHGVLPEPAQSHVLMPRHASRSRLDPKLLTGVVLHWRRVAPAGDRSAVCIDEAWEQAARCRALDAPQQRAIQREPATL